MRRPLLAAASALAALLTSVALAPVASADPSPTGLEHRNVPVCARAQEGIASCDAIRRDAVDRNGKPVAQPMATPAGFGPGDIQAAYHLTGLTSAASDTVAIVDAYDAPNAQKDLAVYRSQYRLPACTTANGCFRKTTQTGKGSLPAANAAWAQESRWTWTWCRRRALPATSCSWRQ